MKLLYLGELMLGATSLQRAEAFGRIPGVELIGLATGTGVVGRRISLYNRLRWKLRWPIDDLRLNESLVAAALRERPEVVVVDNSKVIRRDTLATLRRLGVRCLAYYTPDDVMGRHNLSWTLKASLPDWDVFFTTKTFNVAELAAAGVRNVVLMGKAFDADIHRPVSPQEAGPDYERFDLVFAGAFEKERCDSINALAEAGFSVVVYGDAHARWSGGRLHSRATLREPRFAHLYTRALHHGKIALCFLRKLNRDRITQRTMEIAAMGRPMLAEKTDEHDVHFVDGSEYQGFSSNSELIAKAREMLDDDERRAAIGRRALARCRSSGYSSDERALQMIEAIRSNLRSSANAPTVHSLVQV